MKAPGQDELEALHTRLAHWTDDEIRISRGHLVRLVSDGLMAIKLAARQPAAAELAAALQAACDLIDEGGAHAAMTPADRFIVAAAERGVDSILEHVAPLRYAAHECYHAMLHQKRLARGPWSNMRVNSAIVADLPRFADRLSEELEARVVEQIVCRALGAPCEPLEHTIDVMVRESAAYDRVAVPFEPMLRAARKGVASPRLQAAADRLLALMGFPGLVTVDPTPGLASQEAAATTASVSASRRSRASSTRRRPRVGK